MLLTRDVLDRIESGDVSIAFRSWKRPTVRVGGTLRTAIGVLHIDEITVITPDQITEVDATAAGATSRDELLTSLRRDDDRQLYRIRFHRAGDDPRVTLRTRTDLAVDDRTDIDRQLGRWDDASRDGRWTRQVLELIAAHPGVRSADLAARLDIDQQRLKRRVRQLKGLGLTESLDTGYRLSPRGQSYIATTKPRPDTVR